MGETVAPGGHASVDAGGGGGGTQIVDIQKFGGVAINQGQDVAANSMPVVLASDASIAITPGSTVLAAFSAGSAIIGKVGVDQTTPGTTNGVQTLTGSLTQPIPGTTGGLTPYHRNVTADVTGRVVKASAGMLYGVQISNSGATAGFLHLYDSSSAPTAGSGTIVKTLIAPGPGGGGGGGIVWSQPLGLVFAAGISYTFTTVITDADATVPSASQFSIEMDYK